MAVLCLPPPHVFMLMCLDVNRTHSFSPFLSSQQWASDLNEVYRESLPGSRRLGVSTIPWWASATYRQHPRISLLTWMERKVKLSLKLQKAGPSTPVRVIVPSKVTMVALSLNPIWPLACMDSNPCIPILWLMLVSEALVIYRKSLTQDAFDTHQCDVVIVLTLTNDEFSFGILLRFEHWTTLASKLWCRSHHDISLH